MFCRIIVVIFIVFLIQDTFCFFSYKFCKQLKGKSDRECRNLYCKKMKSCPFNTIIDKEKKDE